MYSRAALAGCEGASVPDLVGPGCRLLFVGINPGLQTALTGIHFAHPSNRFWPALHRAGVIDRVPDVSPPFPAVALAERSAGGLGATTNDRRAAERLLPLLGTVALDVARSARETGEHRRRLVEHGIGITNLVARATARASQLTRSELEKGGDRLRSFVARRRPQVVAVAGLTAFRTAFGDRRATPGRQGETLEGAELWVVPNPSGLNAHETVESLAEWYGDVAGAAGVGR